MRIALLSGTGRDSRHFLLFTSLVAFVSAMPIFAAETAAPLSALGRMPVKELTVFKDGHAFVAREGKMATEGSGNVLMDDLPAPVLGTFWPYSADANAHLTGTVASRRRVIVERTALTLRELLEANIGAEGIVTEDLTNHYTATIVGIPARSSAELEATSPPNSGEKLPEKGSLILLKTSNGIKAVSLDRIQDFTFRNAQHATTGQEEFRNLLTLKLDWQKGKAAKTANVGLFYLQKGVRWIPNYKVTLDGNGQATVKLQATLINELTDLDDVAVNLVVGVPTFEFKDTLDPMALQQTVAQLSQYFANDPGRFMNNGLAQNFSNAIMTQQMGRAGNYAPSGPEPAAPADLGPEIAEGRKNEDLYVFNVKHVTLKKGDRMVLVVAEFTIPYQDVFTLELPFGPPPEARGNLNSDQQRELAKLLSSPKVMHKVRLNNKSSLPLTTAPALVFRDGRVLSQGLMTYTAPGSQSDLAITTAVDIQAKKSDLETKRLPNAFLHEGSQYTRIDLKGKLTVANRRAQPVDLEVTRYILGNVESAGQDGKIEKIDMIEDDNAALTGYDGQPFWWTSPGWPNWWNTFNGFNGIGRITWKLTLEPGKTEELEYGWFYFWR